MASLTHISQLEVLHWVDHLGPEKHILARSRNCKTYNVFPDPVSPPWMHVYTLFCEDPRTDAPPNALIRRIAGIKENHRDVNMQRVGGQALS